MSFIVAEVGVNWDGDFDLAKEMMTKAKQCGCDAVKFQSFNEKLVQNHPEKARLLKTTISEKNVEVINKLSKSVGIEWFCTPMYTEAVNFLDPYVKRFKIREVDGRPLLKNETTPLLDIVLKRGKEVIISSKTSPRHSKYFATSQIKWLYCVPKYPCPLEDINFSELKDFKGFSNHSPHKIVPLMAAILGAKIIELHVTSDKSRNFIDNNVSFDYVELKEVIDLIRQSEKIKR
jgi:sialic acid synthase SpsE